MFYINEYTYIYKYMYLNKYIYIYISLSLSLHRHPEGPAGPKASRWPSQTEPLYKQANEIFDTN